MKNTKKIAAALMAALTLAGVSYAQAQAPQCAASPMMANPMARVQAQGEAMTRLLALKEGQKKSFAAYQAAREDFARKVADFQQQAFQKPCVDEQSRLERRSERHALLGAAFKTLATSRAAFVKTLDAQQRLVLETLEADRGFSLCLGPGPRGMGRGMGMGPGRMAPGHMGPANAMGPRGPKASGAPCPMGRF